MIYQVKDPQGQIHEIDGPEGASPDEVIAQAQKLIPKNQPTPDMNAGLNRAAGVSQGAQDAILGPVAKASNYLVRGASNLITGSEKPAEYLQRGVGAVGKGIQNAEGYAAEKLGAMMPNHPYVAAAIPMAAEVAASYLFPEVAGEVKALPGTDEAARMAIFKNKSMLKKLPGGVEQGNAIGREMLNKGVITPLASKATMADRAGTIAEQAGARVAQIPNALDSISKNGMDVNAAANEIADTLKPKLEKGAFQGDVNALNEVLDTVKAGGDSPSFSQAQAIKQKLQELGKFPKGIIVDHAQANKINMFRRASGIFNRHMENAIRSESPSLVEKYIAAKKEYGPAASAVKGLTDQDLSEAGNVTPSLRGTIAGSEALGRGDIGKAAMLVGGYDLLSRKGAQIAAHTLGKSIPNALNNSVLRNAALASFISRVTAKSNQDQP